MTDTLTSFSDRLADHVAAAAPGLVALYPGSRAQRTGYAWQPGLVVTSEQRLPDAEDAPAMLHGGRETMAKLAGRDPGTNLAVFKLGVDAPALADAEPRVGTLALALGSADGSPTAALGLVHQLGPAWDSMAGGMIDRLIRLDLRLSSMAEGGPVLDASGGLLGMSTFGPRRRVLVIPASTVRRALPALMEGRAESRGWLGLGLQPVGLPAGLREAAGRDTGLMVMSVAPNGPAERAGVLPGDILLDVDGMPAPHPRAVARALAGDRVGATAPLKLLRGGLPIELPATIASRPAP